MSLYAVEKVFWEFGTDPDRIAAFRADPDGYLAPYRLEPDERDMIKRVDLKALAERGVSTLLTMMVWPMLKGPEGMPFSYLEHMNGGVMPPFPGMPPQS
ncbi:MAG: hypothetical protein H5U26_03150 [Immundisolibacter sp.]|uniref:hypothetical protein n=1 Tax=Immundisolibacter sp. TaxID=1934948 RepID=UPI0019AECACF|nr:hypothetical protein [Immundisolibacter sp.]MBC7161094.1 hypothetical protein [Immundisolibacter sp.]